MYIKNKYLEQIGVSDSFYKIPRDEKKSKKCNCYLFETWDLARSWAEWLFTHCHMYLDETLDIIDLDYYKFEYAGNVYTQKEMIDMIIVLLADYLVYIDSEEVYEAWVEEEIYDNLRIASEMWSLIVGHMWW